jgi:DNA polymerase III subunit epsilon
VIARWDLPLAEATLVFVDLETTSVDETSGRICEIAAIRFEGSREVARVASLVRSIAPVGASRDVHGIDDAMLESAPALAALDIESVLSNAIVVGHRVDRDVAFLRAAMERGEMAPIDLSHTLDTFSLARRAFHAGSYSLASLCARFDLSRPAHRALPDAVACRALFEVIRGALRAPTPRALMQAQQEEKPLAMRDDIGAVLSSAHASGRTVRFAYRVPGKDPFEDVLEIQEITKAHVSGRLLERHVSRTLRGDRLLWAEAR